MPCYASLLSCGAILSAGMQLSSHACAVPMMPQNYSLPHLAIPTHSERLSDHMLDDLKRLAWDINCLVEAVPGEASNLGDTRHVGK